MNSLATGSALSLRLAGLVFLTLVQTALLHASDSPSIKWLLGGHTREINSVAFSPDGSMVASASDDFTIKFWRVSDNVLVRTLVGHTEDVRSAAFSPDGSLLVSASQDRTVRIWRVADGALLRTIADSRDVRQAAFSPDGRHLVAGNDRGLVRILRTSDWTTNRTLQVGTGLEAFAISPDGATLAVAFEVPARINLWGISNGFLTLALGPGTNIVRSLAYSPDGQWLASAGTRGPNQNLDPGAVDLWRLADGVLATNLVGHTAQVRSVAFTRDSKFLASASFDSTVKLWDPGTGALLWSVTNDMPESNVRETEMRAVAFSPNGQLLATGDKSDRVKLWQASDGSLKAVLTGHSGSIESVALSANGQYLATGASGHDDRVKLWRISDRALVRTIPGYLGFERSVALSPDGTLLAVSSFNLTNFARSVRVWKTADGSLRHDLRVQDRVSGPGALAFSFDGTRLASANPGSTLDVWDVASGTLAFTATNAVVRGDFYSVAWSPDGNLLATASGTQPFTIDHSVALWEASGGKLLRLLIQNERPVPALAFSPDSTTLASGGTEFVAGVPVLQLWKVTDGTLIRVLRGQVSNTVGVAFSPDGQVLASANTDNTLRFWRVSDGALLHTLGEEMYNILVLGASTEFLAVGRDDATAVLLDWPVIFARTELLPDGRLALGWLGAKGPYQLQVRTNFTSDNWRNAGSRQAANSFTNPIRGSASFFRVFGRTD